MGRSAPVEHCPQGALSLWITTMLPCPKRYICTRKKSCAVYLSGHIFVTLVYCNGQSAHMRLRDRTCPRGTHSISQMHTIYMPSKRPETIPYFHHFVKGSPLSVLYSCSCHFYPTPTLCIVTIERIIF